MGALVPRRRPWDDAGCFALDYLAGEDPAEPRRALVHALKAGEAPAVHGAALLLAIALAERRRLLTSGGDAWLVAIPGHRVGHAGPTDDLCRCLSALLPWLRHCPAGLLRHRATRQSSTAAARPSIAEHLESLTLLAPVRGSVIMVDDVFTHGRVSAACSQLLQDAGASRVLIACVARTRL